MSSPSPVRVRFAPSPTGYLHVGGARTLLFNWLYARKTGGVIVLRVEDTDQARSTRESERMVLSDIEALGLRCDEGPEVGGPHSPYRQSERLKTYTEHARRLLNEGKAYYCFCPAELIGQKREAALKLGKPPVYDGTCARLSVEDANKRLAAGEKAGIRFRAPNRTVGMKDRVRGDVEFKAGTVGDFLITRTPTAAEEEATSGVGMPVYNFCCVIDDHLMGMTHIIRGEDHLSNTARQLMIYEAFGWRPPEFVHIAMVLGGDRQKLSKRNGDVSVRDYLERGYLPEVLLNFLALLGWWPPKDFKPASGHPEVLNREELIAQFNLDGLQKAPAVFDMEKLGWMNGYTIRQMPVAEVARRARPFFERAEEPRVRALVADRSEEWFESMVDLLRSEATLLSDLPRRALIFADGGIHLSAEELKALQGEAAGKVLSILESSLSSVTGELDEAAAGGVQARVAAETGLKGKAVFQPMRVALTGELHGPELKRIMTLLGRDRALERVRFARKQVVA